MTKLLLMLATICAVSFLTAMCKGKEKDANQGTFVTVDTSAAIFTLDGGDSAFWNLHIYDTNWVSLNQREPENSSDTTPIKAAIPNGKKVKPANDDSNFIVIPVTITTNPPQYEWDTIRPKPSPIPDTSRTDERGCLLDINTTGSICIMEIKDSIPRPRYEYGDKYTIWMPFGKSNPSLDTINMIIEDLLLDRTGREAMQIRAALSKQLNAFLGRPEVDGVKVGGKP